MYTPAIAEVIPAYNAGRFIGDAIERVGARTTSQWERVIVDDGSTDETPSRLAAYRDPRIRSIRQDDIGEGAARWRGVSLTRILSCSAVRRLEPFGRLAFACRCCDKPHIRLHRERPIGPISCASE
ncbi:MAG: glycosyltransferase family 2 protein [Nitrospirae bacterium]|nr:glycosyltransferase family 2 protein [Nitrospirota bacterium]MDE3041387.1 glycosyltransferase family 2 protein [Nitrospirota bacterium]MDE3049635.1 glycosyltransferase family 2 protein [Nitrospirota bacterium]MDE3219865.1 glycosyltransferase family 2 protein [Nitrospirota bacterium]